MSERNPRTKGLESPGTLDAMVYDPESGRVTLVLFETRPWDLGDIQLYQLQEKLNAYVSFALDGEMTETYPKTRGFPVALQLRTVHEPSDEALLLLEQVRQQLSFQDITLDVVAIHEQLEDPTQEGGHCGNGSCGCQS
jgi:hypothetical protein